MVHHLGPLNVNLPQSLQCSQAWQRRMAMLRRRQRFGESAQHTAQNLLTMRTVARQMAPTSVRSCRRARYDKAELKKYKAEKYRERQAKVQEELSTKFPWLACATQHAARHCSECVRQPSLSGCACKRQKLSIGYGNDADGQPLPVPIEQKCAEHEA